MQGTMNKMVPPMPQGHFMGMNPMHAGSLPSGGAPPPIGSFQSGIPNMQGYPPGGSFNRAPAGQMPMMPGLNPYQVRWTFIYWFYNLFNLSFLVCRNNDFQLAVIYISW